MFSELTTSCWINNWCAHPWGRLFLLISAFLSCLWLVYVEMRPPGLSHIYISMAIVAVFAQLVLVQKCGTNALLECYSAIKKMKSCTL